MYGRNYSGTLSCALCSEVSSLGSSKCMVGTILALQVVSFVERFIIPCPYLEESTIGGSVYAKLCMVLSEKCWV